MTSGGATPQGRPKFRVWDSQTDSWFTPDFMVQRDGSLIVHTLQQGLVTEHLFPGRFVLEQWTGLADRDGTEVYEGDIVRADFNDGRYPVTHHAVYWLANDGAWSFGIGTTSEVPYYFTVAGNIHENPDLLQP